MDWATALAMNPLTPWGIVGTIVVAVLSGLLVPYRAVKREQTQADTRVADVKAASILEVARVEAIRVAEVARVEKLHDRILAQKDDLLAKQDATIRDLTAAVTKYAEAAEVDITTADIVKNVLQGLQAEHHRQLEGGPQ